MGVATGCGFKEIYRFPHTTYPYSSCICTFLQQNPYFFVHFVNVFIYIYIVKRLCNNYGDPFSLLSVASLKKSCVVYAVQYYKKINSHVGSREFHKRYTTVRREK